MQGKGNHHDGNDHGGGRKKGQRDRELRNSNSGPRNNELNSSTQSLSSSTQSLSSDPPSFNATEAAKYLNDLWTLVNEREPSAVHKDTEKAWGTASKGTPSSTGGLIVGSNEHEFLSELQRAYSKVTQT